MSAGSGSGNCPCSSRHVIKSLIRRLFGIRVHACWEKCADSALRFSQWSIFAEFHLRLWMWLMFSLNSSCWLSMEWLNIPHGVFLFRDQTCVLPVSGQSLYTQFSKVPLHYSIRQTPTVKCTHTCTHTHTRVLTHHRGTAMALKVTGYKTALIPRGLHDFQTPCSLLPLSLWEHRRLVFLHIAVIIHALVFNMGGITAMRDEWPQGGRDIFHALAWKPSSNVFCTVCSL